MGAERSGPVKRTLESYYTTIEDFPAEGILFRDITSVLGDADGFKLAIDEMLKAIEGEAIDVIIGIEARGFMFAPVLAYELGKPFVPVRKAGKLPRETVSATYTLEYGEATIEMHADAFPSGAKVLIVDDLIATGGTAKATAQMVEELGGVVSSFLFVSELTYLNGRDLLRDYKVRSLVTF
ncbi:adenine phosphoribosyltransferase [Peptococcus simiae]|uniref:adenine phosphoribosyltransferase n=1 Tax=Peptococcus simiae TaxID=1643805 RepID=UPI00397E9976